MKEEKVNNLKMMMGNKPELLKPKETLQKPKKKKDRLSNLLELKF